MKKLAAAAFLLGIYASQMTAQSSPEIQADRRVTLRLLAPKATDVKVTGEFMTGEKAMQKDDKGLWSVVVGCKARCGKCRRPPAGDSGVLSGAFCGLLHRRSWTGQHDPELELASRHSGRSRERVSRCGSVLPARQIQAENVMSGSRLRASGQFGAECRRVPVTFVTGRNSVGSGSDLEWD